MVGALGPRCTPGRPPLHGGLAGPPWVTVARPLQDPHFLHPGFLGLGVGLVYGEKGGLQCLTPSGSWHFPRDHPLPQEDQPFLIRTHLPHRALVSKTGSGIGVRWARSGEVGGEERSQPDASSPGLPPHQCPHWKAGPWTLPGSRGLCPGEGRLQNSTLHLSPARDTLTLFLN